MLSIAPLGCGDDEGPGGPEQLGEGDYADNGVIAVDEQALTGEVEDGRIALAIPIRAHEGSGEVAGALQVLLRNVQNTRMLAQTRAEYSLARGRATTLRATLPLPDGIADQADLVGFSVRVEQRGAKPLRVTRSLLHVLPAYEVRLEGPAKLRAQKLVSYRALVQDPRTRTPRADETVELVLRRGGDEIERLQAQTDESGSAIFELELEEPGDDYSATAELASQGSHVELAADIAVEQPGSKLLLTTDKPIYQPGQTIHLRALALDNPSNQPLRDRAVVFEIEDGKGNKIMKRERTTDAYGIAATAFEIGRVVNMGTFKLQALAGELTGGKTVQVSRYVLPKFDVGIEVDRSFYTPGELMQGRIDARYFFGRKVAGASVLLEASTLDVGENVFQRVMGMTSADGEMSFSVQLPDTLVGIRARAHRQVGLPARRDRQRAGVHLGRRIARLRRTGSTRARRSTCARSTSTLAWPRSRLRSIPGCSATTGSRPTWSTRTATSCAPAVRSWPRARLR